MEGIEGAGKSGAVRCVEQLLRQAGVELVSVREPGGTSFGEAIRELLLHRSDFEIAPISELLLMFASRHQLVQSVINPALARGAWVLTDRFTDSSYAYQGAGRGLAEAEIAALEARFVVLKPALTILLDVPVEIGMQRRLGQRAADRIERESLAFFERVRQGFLARGASEPKRFVVLDAAQPEAVVHAQLGGVIERVLRQYRGRP